MAKMTAARLSKMGDKLGLDPTFILELIAKYGLPLAEVLIKLFESQKKLGAAPGANQLEQIIVALIKNAFLAALLANYRDTILSAADTETRKLLDELIAALSPAPAP